ncbi:MAG: hypothetical protein HOC77_11355 [Chloroflexi bacterium]|jgi:hypothetical protein|nr:hypothetical protein [Chloroflexota bacterium]MBT4072577.1 hypothetical protein [Chloroflexota bacterium]MBT4515674.1 hypothetical protein [Chloroflexota bacterium]MBT6681310.1 hypothetical protein [Chloroflexota bacterium]
MRERHYQNNEKHPAACTCWSCDLAAQKRRGLDPAIPGGAQVSDSIIGDAQSILDASRGKAVSRDAKRSKSKEARNAAKRARNQGGRKKKKGKK